MTYTNQEFYDAIADVQAYIVNESRLVKISNLASLSEEAESDNLLLETANQYKFYFTQHLLLCPSLNAIVGPEVRESSTESKFGTTIYSYG
jgi:F0F1-type ATP synthase beta subunit